MKHSDQHAAQAFPARIPRKKKRAAGRTDRRQTTLHLRTLGSDLDDPTRAWVRDRAVRRLGKYALHIERLSFRFEDVNGDRGGRDSVCRGKVVLSGAPSAIVQKRAHTPREAFNLVSQQLARSVDRAVRRLGRVSPTHTAAPPARARAVSTSVEASAGSLIGRRVGRSWDRVLAAAERPEKLRRDAITDTALEGVSETDRKVGKRGTATRNTKLNTRRATATLEDSATGRASRKSTRRSANRALSGSKLARKTKRKLHSPKQRARRAKRR